MKTVFKYVHIMLYDLYLHGFDVIIADGILRRKPSVHMLGSYDNTAAVQVIT
jgi:hypothetical protein